MAPSGHCGRRMRALLYAFGSARPTVSRRGAGDVHGLHRETTMLYRGSCHCGDVTFEAEGDLQGVMACNCSICRRKGALMWFVPRDHMKLLTPDENLATYMVQQARDPASLLQALRDSRVRRGRRSEGHRDGCDQRALHRRRRPRRAARHALRRPLALSGAPVRVPTRRDQAVRTVAQPLHSPQAFPPAAPAPRYACRRRPGVRSAGRAPAPSTSATARPSRS